MKTLEKEIDKYLKDELEKDRYIHTLGVAAIAEAMAMRYNPDVTNSDFMKKAHLAGMLHDSAKCMSHEKKIKICIKNNIEITDFEKDNPFLLHGKVGAFIAKDKFDIKDTDILNAITWHTTGRPNMSDLEKIIFIADYIEPNRKPIKELDEIRKLAFLDLDKTMIKILENTLAYLEEKGSPIDEMTARTYESIKNN